MLYRVDKHDVYCISTPAATYRDSMRCHLVSTEVRLSSWHNQISTLSVYVYRRKRTPKKTNTKNIGHNLKQKKTGTSLVFQCLYVFGHTLKEITA